MVVYLENYPRGWNTSADGCCPVILGKQTTSVINTPAKRWGASYDALESMQACEGNLFINDLLPLFFEADFM